MLFVWSVSMKRWLNEHETNAMQWLNEWCWSNMQHETNAVWWSNKQHENNAADDDDDHMLFDDEMLFEGQMPPYIKQLQTKTFSRHCIPNSELTDAMSQWLFDDRLWSIWGNKWEINMLFDDLFKK